MERTQEIKRLVAESDLFNQFSQQLHPDDALHWDSMSLIWFITKLEEQYGLQIDYREIDLKAFESIDSIERFLEVRMKGRAS